MSIYAVGYLFTTKNRRDFLHFERGLLNYLPILFSASENLNYKEINGLDSPAPPPITRIK